MGRWEKCMYRVMLVEDEEFILQGIYQIIDWEKLDLKVVHMAHDGMEALQLWEMEEVDIVITDISMPEMNGLQLMEELRKRAEHVRFIILSGYDEFEYARKAIRLDVENYILKPIDEEQLEQVLKQSVEKLKQMNLKQKEKITYGMELNYFVNGELNIQEMENFLRHLGFEKKHPYIAFAYMKIDVKSIKYIDLSKVVSDITKKYEKEGISLLYLQKDVVLLICSFESEHRKERYEFYSTLQNDIESQYGIMTFVSISSVMESLMELPEKYKELKKLQRYLIIEGYGSCIDESYIEDRSTTDIMIDEAKFYKMILEKNKISVISYIEDLFLNNAKKENISIDAIYEISIQICMILKKIQREYELMELKEVNNITTLLENLYQAEDIITIKSSFIAEIIEIMDQLNIENSQYTPVIKQILQEIKSHYKEELSLKTLSYKYHINSSYLGQIFQKEIGCSFSQYINNFRNSKARELILNTNKKMNEIAIEVGYPDTSYFYRKFKQCYGVSPASLREMKNYE